MKAKITEKIPVKNPLTEEQKLGLLDDIVKASDRIKELEFQIEDLKEQIKPLKEAIDRESDNISQAIENRKAGFVMSNVECEARYEKGIASYYSVETGEKVLERELSAEEQLRLNEGLIDAEKIIRQDSENE
jgi:hypothetical protein